MGLAQPIELVHDRIDRFDLSAGLLELRPKLGILQTARQAAVMVARGS
jgi:hypothetical protein